MKRRFDKRVLTLSNRTDEPRKTSTSSINNESDISYTSASSSSIICGSEPCRSTQFDSSDLSMTDSIGAEIVAGRVKCRVSTTNSDAIAYDSSSDICAPIFRSPLNFSGSFQSGFNSPNVRRSLSVKISGGNGRTKQTTPRRFSLHDSNASTTPVRELSGQSWVIRNSIMSPMRAVVLSSDCSSASLNVPKTPEFPSPMMSSAFGKSQAICDDSGSSLNKSYNNSFDGDTNNSTLNTPRMLICSSGNDRRLNGGLDFKFDGGSISSLGADCLIQIGSPQTQTLCTSAQRQRGRRIIDDKASIDQCLDSNLHLAIPLPSECDDFKLDRMFDGSLTSTPVKYNNSMLSPGVSLMNSNFSTAQLTSSLLLSPMDDDMIYCKKEPVDHPDTADTFSNSMGGTEIASNIAPSAIYSASCSIGDLPSVQTFSKMEYIPNVDQLSDRIHPLCESSKNDDVFASTSRDAKQFMFTSPKRTQNNTIQKMPFTPSPFKRAFARIEQNEGKLGCIEMPSINDVHEIIAKADEIESNTNFFDESVQSSSNWSLNSGLCEVYRSQFCDMPVSGFTIGEAMNFEFDGNDPKSIDRTMDFNSTPSKMLVETGEGFDFPRPLSTASSLKKTTRKRSLDAVSNMHLPIFSMSDKYPKTLSADWLKIVTGKTADQIELTEKAKCILNLNTL